MVRKTLKWINGDVKEQKKIEIKYVRINTASGRTVLIPVV